MFQFIVLTLVMQKCNIKKMGYEWDDKKAEVNKKKHGVSFAEAATAFQDSNALELFDVDSSSYGNRWILVGLSAKNRILLVVFVEKQKNSIRIISARKAERDEVDQYFLEVNK